MDKWEAQFKFWSQFGIPAYEENSVPDMKEVTFPYISYEAAVGAFGDEIAVVASVWDRSASRMRVDTLCNTIEKSIRDTLLYEYEGVRLRAFIPENTPFAQSLGDDSDDAIKRNIINVTFEFMEV